MPAAPMPAAPVPAPMEDKGSKRAGEVMRTYTAGLSFQHYPAGERKEKRASIAEAVTALGQASAEACREHAGATLAMAGAG